MNFNDDTFSAIDEMLDAVAAPPGKTMASRILGLHQRAEAEAKGAAEKLARCERQRDDYDAALQGAQVRLNEALDELNAAEQALTDSAITDGETLSERIRELATRAAKYHGALVEVTTERDNCREVLRKEREERATEKATLGAALQALRAETETLGDSVDRLHEENERLAAQLEFAERVLIAGIRRATP